MRPLLVTGPKPLHTLSIMVLSRSRATTLAPHVQGKQRRSPSTCMRRDTQLRARLGAPSLAVWPPCQWLHVWLMRWESSWAMRLVHCVPCTTMLAWLFRAPLLAGERLRRYLHNHDHACRLDTQSALRTAPQTRPSSSGWIISSQVTHMLAAPASLLARAALYCHSAGT
jgi:hypothetical protein